MIRAENISVSFAKPGQKSVFGKERQTVLDDVSFSLMKGECLGILGESGSGKSTLGKVLTGLLKPQSGQVYMNEVPVYEGRKLRRIVQSAVVFQDYWTSVNVRFSVADIIRESSTVLARRTGVKVNEKEEVARLLGVVGLPAEFAKRYPHQLSGGQLQRVCIARAIAVHPDVILFDEAVSSLDAHTQVQVMDLLKALKDEYGFTYIFITHDLPSVTYMCDRVIVLNRGHIEEDIEVSRLSEVTSEYAKKLLHSVLDLKEA